MQHRHSQLSKGKLFSYSSRLTKAFLSSRFIGHQSIRNERFFTQRRHRRPALGFLGYVWTCVYLWTSKSLASYSQTTSLVREGTSPLGPIEIKTLNVYVKSDQSYPINSFGSILLIGQHLLLSTVGMCRQ
jgi:hypothetical protein